MMISRRSFVGKTAAVITALPLFNIGKAGASPSGAINHASFGSNNKAFHDITNMMSAGDVNLVAVAEVDSSRLGKVLEAFPKVKVYTDWREMLDKEGHHLDSVNVSTPDHMHAPMAVSAMNLGINVYGQKPLAHTVGECREIANIAKETGVVTQLGTQLTSSTYERLAVQMIQDGVIGKVKEVHLFSDKKWGDPKALPQREDPIPESLDWDLWCGVAEPRPYISYDYYAPKGWRRRLDLGCGTLGDMGCHIFSPMLQAFGFRYPLSVKSPGGKPNATNWAINNKIEYTFPGSELTVGKTLKATWTDGDLRPPQHITKQFGEKMPKEGSIFIGTEGILLQPHRLLPIPYPREKFKGYRYPKFPARDHYKDYLAAIRGEHVKPLADFVDYGGLLTEAILVGGIATHFPKQQLNWDVSTMRFTNCPEANPFLTKSYRKGWEVDGLC